MRRSPLNQQRPRCQQFCVRSARHHEAQERSPRMIDMTGIKGYFHGQAPGLPVEANATALNLTPLTDEQIASLNIHQRVRRIVAEIRSLPKSQWNPEGEFAYAGHDQIIDMLRMLLV